jgi:small GTP-binding protein
VAEDKIQSGFDFLFKTIVVGDGAVGKTAITYRYATNKFQENYKMTIGVDFTIKEIEYKGKKVKVQVWDTGGQEKFKNIRPLYYQGALGGLVVFDVTLRESYENIETWIGEVLKNCHKMPAIMLVGNKIDIADREVTSEEGKELAKKISKKVGMKIPYYETSAKTGETIKEVFSDLVHQMVDDALKQIRGRKEK